MRRRRMARAAFTVGLVVLALAALSEWRSASWWSAVRLPPPSGPDQRFISLSRAQIRAGIRGTAGFFTRAIPRPGWSLSPPSRIPSDLPDRLWLPGYFSVRQTRSISIPLYPLAGALLLAGAWAFPRRQRLGHCARCGYNLQGVTGRCPECGAQAHATSSPSVSS